MSINFPSSPSSGQRYEFSFNAWTWNGTFWQSTGASGSITSGNIGNNAIFSGNIASGSISAFSLASGVIGGGSLVLTSGTVVSGLIGNNAVTSGNIASGQIGLFHFISPIDGAGYFIAGGDSLAIYQTGDKLNFSNDTTIAKTTANLSQIRINLAGVSENTTKGYLAGGYDGVSGDTVNADKLLFATDTSSASTVSNLSQARGYLAGCSGEGTKGYFTGGGAALTTSDRIAYSNDTTAAQTTADLPIGILGLAAVTNGSTKGFYAGGFDSGGNELTDVYRITYSNDTTSSVTVATLSQNRGYLSGVTGETAKGYFIGGYFAGNILGTADKIIYSTEVVTAQTSANLTNAHYQSTGVSQGINKGFVAGGLSTGFVFSPNADKINYSNDTTNASTTANLSQARGGLASVNQYSVVSPLLAFLNDATVKLTAGGTKGFFAGGDTGIYNLVATADKLTYSTETTVAQTSANLSQPRRSLAGCSGEGNKGYFAGGDATTGLVKTTDIINYSSEITSYNSSSDLSQARNTAGITEGSTKGYFAGGTYTVQLTDKITFSNNTTAAQTTANLSQGRVGLAGCSGDRSKGYYVGGVTNVGSAKVSTADKLNYLCLKIQHTIVMPSKRLDSLFLMLLELQFLLQQVTHLV